MRFISKKCILGLLAFILSCSTSDSEKYYTTFSFIKPTNKPATTFKSKKRIAIQTFIDEREKDNISYLPMQYLPFVPYASSHFNRPENVERYSMKFLPEIDLAKGLESELTGYSIFEKVFYTDRSEPKNSDYIFLCKIKKNRIYSKGTIYAATTLYLIKSGNFSTVFFIILFVPITTAFLATDYLSYQIEIELELKEIKTGQTVLRKTLLKEETDFEIGHAKERQYAISNRFFKINQNMIQEMSKEIIQYFEGNKK
jgi:hypothetical protein